VTILADQLPEPIAGSVREIAPNADPVSRTYLVKVFFDNADLRLKPGMFAKARFILEERPEALVVPRECVIRDAGGTHSLFLVEDGKALSRAVTIGIQANDLVEIAAGVTPQDLVVTHGQGDLQAGVRVAVISGGAR
jgi:RND family efflux transporter MFP subunit